MDLLDLIETTRPKKDPYEKRPGMLFPTLGYEPQRTPQVQQALIERDWKTLKYMRVRWYDLYNETWHDFSPAFWKPLEYDWPWGHWPWVRPK